MNGVNRVNRDTTVPRVLERIRRRSSEAAALLRTLCQISERRSEPIYLVGGLVRDMLLGDELDSSQQVDMDVAVDAEINAYIAAIESAADGPVTRHDRFETASAVLQDGVSLDLARTRAERYPEPGSLPLVAPAPIEVDLRRRDFTINAAAIALSGPRAGTMLDPYDTVVDLQARRIRTLHRDSFRDDPTRLIRAARYAARIDGVIERRTLQDARRDRHLLSSLSAGRFGDAWRLLLRDVSATEALKLAARLKIPQSRDARWTVRVRQASDVRSPEHFWATAGLRSSDREIAAWLPQTVALYRTESAALSGAVQLRGMRRRLGAIRRPSKIADAVAHFPVEVLEAAAAEWPGTSGDAVRTFLCRRGSIRAPISAERLLELGVPQGPEVGAHLRRLAAMVWDGELDPDDREAVARMEERIRWSP